MQKIPVKVDENPSQSFMAQIPYGTLDIAITRIIHMKEYTAFETTELVGHFPLFHL